MKKQPKPDMNFNDLTDFGKVHAAELEKEKKKVRIRIDKQTCVFIDPGKLDRFGR